MCPHVALLKKRHQLTPRSAPAFEQAPGFKKLSIWGTLGSYAPAVSVLQPSSWGFQPKVAYRWTQPLNDMHNMSVTATVNKSLRLMGKCLSARLNKANTICLNISHKHGGGDSCLLHIFYGFSAWFSTQMFCTQSKHYAWSQQTSFRSTLDNSVAHMLLFYSSQDFQCC